MSPQVVNLFEIRLTALGDVPFVPQRTSPGASRALDAAVEAAVATLEAHGYTIAHRGYGVRPETTAVPPARPHSLAKALGDLLEWIGTDTWSRPDGHHRHVLFTDTTPELVQAQRALAAHQERKP